MNYDNWKLDNNEQTCTCDCCEREMDEKEGHAAMGYQNNKLELVCESCVDDLVYCDNCGRVGDDDCFSYGHEMCDSCCDIAVDKYRDRD